MTDLPKSAAENQTHELVQKLRVGFHYSQDYGSLVNSVKPSDDGGSIEFELPHSDTPFVIIRDLLKRNIPANAYQSTREETGKNTYSVSIEAIESAPAYEPKIVHASERLLRTETNYRDRF